MEVMSCSNTRHNAVYSTLAKSNTICNSLLICNLIRYLSALHPVFDREFLAICLSAVFQELKLLLLKGLIYFHKSLIMSGVTHVGESECFPGINVERKRSAIRRKNVSLQSEEKENKDYSYLFTFGSH